MKSGGYLFLGNVFNFFIIVLKWFVVRKFNVYGILMVYFIFFLFGLVKLLIVRGV